MRSQSPIVEVYRTADSERRLNLFLECPDLRKAFIEIETREESHRSQKVGRSRFWNRLFWW